MKAKFLLGAALVLLAVTANAQQRVTLKVTNKEWEQPFPAFKIVGNLYYVGTYDLGCYLIATDQGLILINSGAPGSFPLIKANIESLGFKLTDIKIITSTHGHWDHGAGMPRALQMITQGNGGRNIPVYLHPEMFALRATKAKDGTLLPMELVRNEMILPLLATAAGTK